jgi:hypothetical protein
MSIGDLANDLARLLYEQRIAVAILSVVGVVAVAIIAWRLGWLAAAARHPRRTLALVAVVLAVTLPVGWYLGSPIFVRTSLVEAFPSAVPTAAATPAPTLAPTASAAGSASPAATIAPTPSPTPEPTPFAPVAVATASWEGTDDFHFASGSASIVEVQPGRYQLRLEDFSIRNGPDLYVYLSPSADGWTEDSVELGLLKATDGAFGYDIPAGVDIEAFRSAIVWCKAFSHLFATAPFET